MNLNLIVRTARDRRFSAPIIAVSLIGYVLLILSIWPAFKDNPGLMQVMKSYPKAVLSLVAGGGGGNFLTNEGFISIEFLQLWWLVIVGAYAMTMATAIVAKEVDDGTMDILLTQPLKRSTLIMSRFVADLIIITSLVLVTTASIWFVARAYAIDLNTTGIIVTGILGLSVFIFIEAYSLLLGIFMERGRAIIIAVSIFLVSHLLNGLADINKTIDKFRWMSFLKYYRPMDALKTGHMPWKDIGLFLGLATLCIIAALVVFQRKDIAS